MDRKQLAASVAMTLAGVTLLIDGIVTVSGRSGQSYRAFRIFVSAGGPGTNHFVGRGEIIAGAVVAILSLGLWLGRRWGWVVGVVFGVVALWGFQDSAPADELVAICGVAILVTAFIRTREVRRTSLSGD